MARDGIQGSPLASSAFDWKAALRRWRRRTGQTQVGLAAAAGVSVASIRAYERGARHPSGRSLTDIVRALGIPRQEANQLLAAAGYAVDWQTLLEGRYVSDRAHARSQMGDLPWPAFIADQGFNLVAANHWFELVWDVDLRTDMREPGRANFLAGVSDPRFVSCVGNFDELVSFMIGLAKGDPRLVQDMERPAPWLREALSIFLRGDPSLITRVGALWERAAPVTHWTRHQYPIDWLHRGERRLRFIGLLTIADLWNELSWNDWIPADEETWRALREIAAEDGQKRTHES